MAVSGGVYKIWCNVSMVKLAESSILSYMFGDESVDTQKKW